MTLYLYKIGTDVPLLTFENVRQYTAEMVMATDSSGSTAVYTPLAEDCELSSRADCSETLRADWRAAHPDERTRIEELEALMAELLYGGEGV